MYRGKFTQIIVYHVSWKTDWQNTFSKHDIDIMCTVEHLLTSSCIMYYGKLTDKIRFVNMTLTLFVLWKTYSHHRVSCIVENLFISSCIMCRGTLTYIIVYHVPWNYYCGKFINIIRFLNMNWLLYFITSSCFVFTTFYFPSFFLYFYS